MLYPDTAATGHAGEYFFAYQITSVLRWPCRLLDMDIGIDAQVEIVDQKTKQSTGKFVAFQVKSTSDDEAACRYVTKAQLKYWKELELPVFVALVNLSDEEMYLRQVDPNKQYPHAKNNEDSIHIDFDKERDIFSERSRSVIESSADAKVLKLINVHLDTIYLSIRKIQEAFNPHCPDDQEVERFVSSRNQLKSELDKAEAISKSMNACHEAFRNARNDLYDAFCKCQRFMTDFGMLDGHRNMDLYDFAREDYFMNDDE